MYKFFRYYPLWAAVIFFVILWVPPTAWIFTSSPPFEYVVLAMIFEVTAAILLFARSAHKYYNSFTNFDRVEFMVLKWTGWTPLQSRDWTREWLSHIESSASKKRTNVSMEAFELLKERQDSPLDTDYAREYSKLMKANS